MPSIVGSFLQPDISPASEVPPSQSVAHYLVKTVPTGRPNESVGEVRERMNGNKEEARPANMYDAWTPRLLEVAYNYQFVTKSRAHTSQSDLQILYDSLADLSVKVPVGVSRPNGLRPAAPADARIPFWSRHAAANQNSTVTSRRR
jgi:hypothetical protein